MLIVDDDQISATMMVNILRDVCQCFFVSSAAQATEFYQKKMPDMFVVGMNLPGTSGLAFCKALKAQDETRDVPLLFITADRQESSQLACWESGGNDFVTKPLVAQTLVQRVKNQLLSKLRWDALVRLSYHDPLTGLFNRNYLSQEYPRLCRQLMRESQPLGLMMFDIDYFKQYNDTYGHLKGDICLEEVAEVLKSFSRRARDAVIRYGGEEFIALLPCSNLAGTRAIAEQIVKGIYALNLPHTASPINRVTVSAGVVSVQHVERYALNDVIEQADINLYDAKLKGRNRVVSG